MSTGGDFPRNGDDATRQNGLTQPPDSTRPRGAPENLDELTDELERQARETMRVIRETAGDLGARVREALSRASAEWDEPHPPTHDTPAIPLEHEQAARRLARRWSSIDFLVDPELAENMIVSAVRETAVWKVALRERGETRSLEDGSEAYQGNQPQPLGPVLPLWEYSFPATPDIESGERRERLSNGDRIGACLSCNGTGNRSCAGCEGRGFVQCPTCHGRARIPCKRCRGRGRIADATAERRARAAKGYFQVQAERLAENAGGRLADIAERLRQEYGVPLPPSAQWAPTAPASGQTIPCPDCVNGSVPCACGNGKLVCSRCHGTSAAPCLDCHGTGRVMRYRELVRRFDTRITDRVLPLPDAEANEWYREDMLRRAHGAVAWEGSLDAVGADAPVGVPASVWADTVEFARGGERALATSSPFQAVPQSGERRVLGRRIRLTRIPLTHVEYLFGGQPYTFVAVGAAGSERFWAQSFPPRWSRVSRFVKALARDLTRDATHPSGSVQPKTFQGLSSIEEFRARREQARPQGQLGDGAPPADPTNHEDKED